ncbi:3-phenylpropionate/trans-cinnamate dioxygenase ferredoxin reductase subunit [Roseiarcus fermentans]|uniref:3-phenylpropionate/trans-cinnamate dioxygenase ferredoxin reductase subunit n=1 Tax=Roseiarcus fermentans TaxID=1473586 RepID=A0A366F7G3_9HYPH|nr:3-phenylpropionate/trans-cinnamate dioxygenase ferredoxin reductase subunit [Roseiarcus fermentans]
MEHSLSVSPVVIVGAGHAGVQAAASLREEGYDGEIVLLSDERELPYQRPPLSKAFLKREMDLHGLPLRAEAFYPAQRIDLRLGARAVRIDRAARTVALADGTSLPYGHLILATGARQRRLEVPGVDLPGVYALRTIADAAALRERIVPGLRVVVIGAGFIGLEVAATAAKLGAETAVVEIARPMGRAVSPALSDFYAEAHRSFGARLFLGVGVREISGTDKAEAVVLSDGEVLPADLVLVGVGVTAEDALARAAGLDCGNGVLVDERLVTSDPAISAIGDCAAFPNATLGFVTRLESIQNAVDQGKLVAARLAGKPKAYDALAWFWSDQGDLKLLIVGLSHDVDQWVVRGDPATRAFSTYGFRKGRLAVVESVNRAGDHAAAKRILASGKTLTPEQAADPDFDIRALAKG